MVIGNGGIGDAADFMNVVTDANGVITTYGPRVECPRPAFSQGSPESVVAGVLFGPFAAPALGVITSAISSIFDLF